jgi:hypothetical protein
MNVDFTYPLWGTIFLTAKRWSQCDEFVNLQATLLNV